MPNSINRKRAAAKDGVYNMSFISSKLKRKRKVGDKESTNLKRYIRFATLNKHSFSICEFVTRFLALLQSTTTKKS